MDPEKTAPFELGSGQDACLLLHGFTGSPWDMRPLGEGLAERGYYVRAIRLPGHGMTPEAMDQVSFRDWEEAAESALHSLSNFRQVFVAGLSMGALLSVLLAARHPERVHGLALMAPAMRFQDPAMRFLRAVQRLPFELLRPWVPKSGSDLESESERQSTPVLPAFPTARLRDLWSIQDKARKALSLVRASTLVAMAKNDHVVHLDGARELVRGLSAAPSVRFIQLERGYHVMTRDLGRELLISEVGEFFDRLRA